MPYHGHPAIAELEAAIAAIIEGKRLAGFRGLKKGNFKVY